VGFGESQPGRDADRIMETAIALESIYRLSAVPDNCLGPDCVLRIGCGDIRAARTSGGVPGTGIGMSIVRKVADANHEHVWVISDDREGTTFFLSLPTGARRQL
jgi:light-regulated signal transduction histidine kinase (bacteriophytochrome)